MALKGPDKSKATATKSAPTDNKNSPKTAGKEIEKTPESNDVEEENLFIGNAEESKLLNPYLGKVEFLERWAQENLSSPSDREGFLSTQKTRLLKGMSRNIEKYAALEEKYQRTQREKEQIGQNGLAYDYVLAFPELFQRIAPLEKDPLVQKEKEKGQNGLAYDVLALPQFFNVAPLEQDPKAEAYLKPYKRKARGYIEAYKAMEPNYLNNAIAYEVYTETGKGFLSEAWKKSIIWTTLKNEKDNTIWEKGEEDSSKEKEASGKKKASKENEGFGEKDAYKRNVLPQAWPLAEKWRKIVPPFPKDPKERLEQKEEERAEDDAKNFAAKQTAREFAQKERKAAKEQNRENALEKNHKELTRKLKNEMRGLTLPTRDTAGKPLDVPVMHILEKTKKENVNSSAPLTTLVFFTPLGYFITTEHQKYKNERQAAVEIVTRLIEKQKKKAIDLRKKWHQLWHPLEDEARKKALSLPFVEYPKGTKPKRKDLPPPSATVVLACKGYPETKKEEMEIKSKKEQKREPEPKGTVPVVTSFLNQQAYKLKPFEKMLEAHKKRAAALEEIERKSTAAEVDEINEKSERVVGITGGLRKLKI